MKAPAHATLSPKGERALNLCLAVPHSLWERRRAWGLLSTVNFRLSTALQKRHLVEPDKRLHHRFLGYIELIDRAEEPNPPVDEEDHTIG